MSRNSRYLLLASAIAIAMLAADRHRASADDGSFGGTLPSAGGIALVRWDGGPVSSVVLAAARQGCGLQGVWLSNGGQLVSYLPGAPDFVNGSFSARFTDGRIPAATPLLVSCRKKVTLKAAPSPATVTGLPGRLESAGAVLFGDQATTETDLRQWADLLQSDTLPYLEGITGLTRAVDGPRPSILIYGASRPDLFPGEVYGRASGSTITMAAYRTPGRVNNVLVTHEYFHWMASTLGKASMPSWFNEGLAYTLSNSKSPTLDSPTTTRAWDSVVASKIDVGNLALVPQNTDGNYVSMAAIHYLIRTQGIESLKVYFVLTGTGASHAQAFTLAFGQTPEAFGIEFAKVVSQARTSGKGPF